MTPHLSVVVNDRIRTVEATATHLCRNRRDPLCRALLAQVRDAKDASAANVSGDALAAMAKRVVETAWYRDAVWHRWERDVDELDAA